MSAAAARMGLESALLAAKGFTGPSTVLEGDKGFLKVYSPSPRPELLLEGMGETYLLLDMTVKAYACHVSFHPVIAGICEFREEHPIDGAALEGVRVAATQRMIDRHGQREPTSMLGAQYSLPFSVAVALLRDIPDPTVYNEETLWDPEVRSLAGSHGAGRRRRSVRGSPAGPLRKCTSSSAAAPTPFRWLAGRAPPGDPYTFDEMADKFRRYAGSRLTQGRVQRIIQKVRVLEDVADVGELAHLLRPE